MSSDVAGLRASQRFDLRRTATDDVVDRVEKMLQVHLDVEGAVRKRRTIGMRSDRGTWIRIECRGREKLNGQGSGLEAAQVLSGVARPDWYGGCSWFDHARDVLWRADETALIEDAPIRRSPAAALDLTGDWWDALNSSLDALGNHATARIATPDSEALTHHRVDAVIGPMFPNVRTTIDEHATAHADLAWANLTSPTMWILDWEDWGTAPRGLDAATLWFASLAQPAVANGILTYRATDLECRTGKLMMLWRCAEFLSWANDDEPAYAAAEQAARRLAGDLR
jgi:hypothetical protein